MQIVEETPQRLVLRHRSLWMTLFTTIFTFFSAVTVILLLWQAFSVFLSEIPVNLWQLGTFLVWISLSIALTVLGVMLWVNVYRGVRCVFDKEAGLLILEQAKFFRFQREEFPIYAVSHLEMQKSKEVRSIALFVVFKDYRKIPLIAFPIHEEEHLNQVVKTVRKFLRS